MVSSSREGAVRQSRYDTRQLTAMALFCALSVVLSFIEFPIIPGVAFLKYDPSTVPALICGFAFGPSSGILVGVMSTIIHGLIMGDFYGTIMNIMVVLGYVFPSALIYTKRHTLSGAVIGLSVGVACSIALAIVGNLFITPIYMGVPQETVVGMILPVLLPFNVVKSLLNAAITLILYKSVSNLIKSAGSRKKTSR